MHQSQNRCNKKCGYTIGDHWVLSVLYYCQNNRVVGKAFGQVITDNIKNKSQSACQKPIAKGRWIFLDPSIQRLKEQGDRSQNKSPTNQTLIESKLSLIVFLKKEKKSYSKSSMSNQIEL